MDIALPEGWTYLVFPPLLLAGGLLADGLALSWGLIDVLAVHIGEEGDFELDWNAAGTILPNVVLTAKAGMCATAVAVLTAIRHLQRGG